MFYRMMQSVQRFMYGRNGVDELSWVLVCTGLMLNLIGSFTDLNGLCFLSYIPLLLALYRMFSKNIDRRRVENGMLEAFWSQLRDREHRYYACPKCGQTVRVPRGKGKLNIRCPRCSERFIKKS